MSRATILVLVAGMLLTGCANTLLTKYQDMQCMAECDTAHPRLFEQPIIQTLQMFVGESGCWLVVLVTIILQHVRKRTYEPNDPASRPLLPNPEHQERPTTLGYSPLQDNDGDLSASQTLVDASNISAKALIDGDASQKERTPLTGSKIALLASPAICDILGTTLMNIGLLFVAASIYQMLRGTLILFVGLFSVIFLKRHLSAWKWASLFIVVLGVAIVGLAGALEHKSGKHDQVNNLGINLQRMHLLVQNEELSSWEAYAAARTVFGLFLIAAAQIFTATQFVLEESIMENYSMDPIQVVGWEGIFGFLITLIGMGILHAAIGQKANGQGGYFDAREGFYEIFHNRAVGVTSLLIMISIGCFNFFGLSVTRSVSATSRSTIDTCRTLFIWIVSLGLGWETFKWLQVLGFALLVYGTFLFNEIVRPPMIAFIKAPRRRTIPHDEE